MKSLRARRHFRERGPRRLSPFFIPMALDQFGLRPHLHPFRSSRGPTTAVVTALLDRRSRNWRCRAVHQHGRRGRDGRAAAANRRSAASVMAGFAAARALVHGLQRHARKGIAALGQRSRWLRDGRGRRGRRSRGAWNTPRRAARKSTPRLSVTVCPAMRITSPRRPRTAAALSAPWRWP